VGFHPDPKMRLRALTATNRNIVRKAQTEIVAIVSRGTVFPNKNPAMMKEMHTKATTPKSHLVIINDIKSSIDATEASPWGSNRFKVATAIGAQNESKQHLKSVHCYDRCNNIIKSWLVN